MGNPSRRESALGKDPEDSGYPWELQSKYIKEQIQTGKGREWERDGRK